MKELVCKGMMVGVFLGEYFMKRMRWLLVRWLGIYVVEEKGMWIVKVGVVGWIGGVCGFGGGVVGGVLWDYVMKGGLWVRVGGKVGIVVGMLVGWRMMLCK